MQNLRINIVLVEPLYPLNIGSSSRAMSNMGGHRMILINRQCELNEQVKQAAATGQEAWSQATEYPDWNSFFEAEPGGVRIALTARGGRARSVSYLESVLEEVKDHPAIKNHEYQDIYFIFGREDHGLSLDDLKECHFSASLELFGTNTSLNLAQAVMLTLFVYQKFLKLNPTPVQNQKNSTIKAASNRLQEQVLKDWLEILGFQLDDRRINALTILRRILFQNVLAADEIRVLEAILEQTLRKLKKTN